MKFERLKTHCDLCKEIFYQDELVNIVPDITAEIDDLIEGYEDFDGMVCDECYSKIEKKSN